MADINTNYGTKLDENVVGIDAAALPGIMSKFADNDTTGGTADGYKIYVYDEADRIAEFDALNRIEPDEPCETSVVIELY